MVEIPQYRNLHFVGNKTAGNVEHRNITVGDLDKAIKIDQYPGL
jgi:hypothetical protein